MTMYFSGPRNLAKAHDTDAGYDIYPDDLRHKDEIYWAPFEVKKVFTSLYVDIPEGHVGIIKERSGFAARGIPLRIMGGVIDAGYKGEVIVLTQNCGPNVLSISTTRAIAQLVVLPIYRGTTTKLTRKAFDEHAEFLAVIHHDAAVNNMRGSNGFGSSDEQ